MEYILPLPTRKFKCLLPTWFSCQRPLQCTSSERACKYDCKFPPTETISPHQPHKKMTKQPTVKACLPSFQHHCIWWGNTFVQDEIEAGRSPKDTFWVPVFSHLQHTGRVFVPVKAGFQKTLCSLKPHDHSRDGEREPGMWHAAFLVITRSLVNNKSS